MRNYILADTKRILGRKSHAFSMLLLHFIFFALLYFPHRNVQVTAVSLATAATSAFDWIFVLVGLFELIAVFSEDFKVKTMQIAIGLGVSRLQVILSKLIEIVILIVLDCIVMLLILLGVGGLFGVVLPMEVLSDVLFSLLVRGLVSVVAHSSLTMIVLFFTQSMILSMFVFCVVGLGLIYALITLAPMIGLQWVETMKIGHVALTYNLNILYSRLVLGSFDVPAFLVICAYTAAGLFATHALFSKRELDF